MRNSWCHAQQLSLSALETLAKLLVLEEHFGAYLAGPRSFLVLVSALSTGMHNLVAQCIAHQSMWCDSVVFLKSLCDSVVFLDCSARASGVVVRDSWGDGVPLVFLDGSAKASSMSLSTIERTFEKKLCLCTQTLRQCLA